MLLRVCAIFDSATLAYGRPIFVTADGQAIRSFMDEVNRADGDSDLRKHPDDFVLFSLGTFDDSSGIFSRTEPSVLMRGKDALNPKE